MARNRQLEVFPIRETNGEDKMKNISPTSLPHFHGMAYEDPDIFLFGFAVVYRTFDYTLMRRNLNYFLLLSRMQPCVGE